MRFLVGSLTAAVALSVLAVPRVHLDAADEGMLPVGPRAVRRQLDQVRAAIREERYAEAIPLLAELVGSSTSPQLAEELHQDYLVPDLEPPHTLRSLHETAERILTEIPDAAYDLYRLQFEPEASAMLHRALENRDLNGLREIIRRFFHTPSGYEATMLLGRFLLDEGEGLAASRCFQRVASVPRAARHFQPQLGILLAVAQRTAGMTDEAKITLDQLRTDYPGAQVRFGTAVRPQAGPQQDTLHWLQEAADQAVQAAARPVRDWSIFRGSPMRNGLLADGGPPVPFLRWMVRVPLVSPLEESIIHKRHWEIRDEGNVALPGLHPLAVANTVLMRSTDRLVAVDFQTGKCIWEWPWNHAAFDYPPEESDGGDERANGAQRGLEELIWEDALWGQLASDSQSVYLLEGLNRTIALGYPHHLMQRGIVLGEAAQHPHNEIVALDLRTEGKLRWRVGGAGGGVDPRLEGAFFLGVPLPYGGKLYALADRRGEVALVVLDPATGKMEWGQQLVYVESSNIAVDPLRRLSGAVPSIAHGVAVCPTGAGVIWGIDLDTRRLLWSRSYQQQFDHLRRHRGGRRSEDRTVRWADNSVTLAEDRALVTPVESDQLLCLNLFTGEVVWSLPRVDSSLGSDVESGATDDPEWLYVGGVRDGHVVLVGKRHVQVVRLTDGEPLWPEPLKIPGEAVPAGRGYLSETAYYLPTTSAQLLRIDLATAACEATRTSQPLGNLICYQGSLLSQSSASLVAFHLREPLQTQVETRLGKDPNDVWALEHQAQLYMASGRPRDALPLLRQAIGGLAAGDPARDPVADMLLEAVLQVLRVEGAEEGLVEEAEKLIDRPDQRLSFLQLVAEAFGRRGELSRAFDAYLEIEGLLQAHLEFPAFDSEAGLVLEEEKLRVAHHRWLRRGLTRLWDAADPTMQARMAERLRERFEQLTGRGDVARLQLFIRVFGDHPVGHQAQLELTRSLAQTPEGLLTAAVYAQQLYEQADQQGAAEGLELLASVYKKIRLGPAAIACYEELRSRWPDQRSGDQTMRERAEAELVSAELVEARQEQAPWPNGWVRVERETENGLEEFNPHGWSAPLDPGGGTHAWRGYRVAIDNPGQLAVLDSWGREWLRAGLQTGRVESPRHPVGTIGQLLLLASPQQLLAVDLSEFESGQLKPCWSRELRSGAITAAIPQLFGGPRSWVWGTPNSRSGGAGPAFPSVSMDAEGIVFQRSGQLVCVEPASGEVLWQRSDVQGPNELFGDREIVFATTANGTKARVFSRADGRELGQRELPPVGRRWTTRGRSMLTWDDRQAHRLLRLVDLWTGVTVWSHECLASAKGYLVGRESVALMQTDGEFRLMDLTTGEVRMEQQLQPVPQLRSLVVLAGHDQYLVAASGPAPSGPRAQGPVASWRDDAPSVHGLVYALDRTSGEPVWQTPAAIDDFQLPLGQPADLPVVIFQRRIPEGRARSPRGIEWICLDRRDGRLLWREQAVGSPNQHVYVHVQGDPTEHQVTVMSADGAAINFTFTDEPRPPAPSAQVGKESAEAGASISDAAGAVLRAIGNGARQVAPRSPDPSFESAPQADPDIGLPPDVDD